MLVIGYNDDPLEMGTSGEKLKVSSVGFEDKDRAEFGAGIGWLPHERPAVVFARISGREITVAFAYTLGLALADSVVEEEVGISLAGRLSALMMSAAFHIESAISQVLLGVVRTFSATPYTTACKCAAGIIGKILASTTLRF